MFIFVLLTKVSYVAMPGVCGRELLKLMDTETGFIVLIFYKLSTAGRVETVISTVQICFDSSLLGFLSLAIYHFLLEYLQNISVIIGHKFYSTEHFSFYLGHRVAISIKLNFPYFIKTLNQKCDTFTNYFDVIFLNCIVYFNKR